MDRILKAEELQEHAGFLSRLARDLVGDEHRAADLTQDAWVAVLERRPQGVRSLRAWLATVVMNLARNARRGEQRRARREEASARPERTDPGQLALERLEIQRAVSELVLALPEGQRTVLYLRYYEGLTPSAIAERLELPVKTVKTRHTRALAELRARLDARSKGRNAEWVSALLPLARQGGAFLGSGGAALVGGIAMKKLVIAIALLLVTFAVWRGTRRAIRPDTLAREEHETASLASPREREEPLEPQPALAAPEPTALEREELPGSPPRASDDRGALLVTLTWSDGTPAAGVTLDVLCANDPAPREERSSACADERGAVRFDGLFPGPARVELDRGGRHETLVAAGETRELAIQIPEGLDVDGTVVDPTGASVAGAEIWCEGQFSRWPSAMLLATCAADGTFRLRGLHEDASFGARARGHRPSVCFTPRGLPVGPGGARTVTLELDEAGGRVEGRVLDPDGQPLAGARVHAGQPGGFLVDLPGVDMAKVLRATSARPAPVVTGADGLFVLPGDIEPGPQPISAAARGFPIWTGGVEVLPDDTARVEIRLERPATISGRVVTDTGEPVADARVVAEERERGYTWPVFPPSQARTDAEGRFELGWLAPGRREIHANVPDDAGLGEAQAFVECSAGMTSACELVLDAGLAITGQVVDAAGRPLSGWNVRGHSGPVRGMEKPRYDVTDAAGRFVLANLSEGACLIVVSGPDDPVIPARATLDGVLPGEDVVLVVEDAGVRKGRFHGRIRDVDGQPARDVEVVLFAHEGGGSGLYVELDRKTGELSGEALPGSYVLVVLRGAGTVGRSDPFDVLEEEDADVGAISLETPGRLEVTVLGLRDGMLENVRFWLDRRGRTGAALEAVDGILRSGELEPGTYVVKQTEREIYLRPVELVVHSGETTRAELSIEPSFPVELALTNPREGREAPEPPEQWLDVESRAADGSLLDQVRLKATYAEGRATLRIHLPEGRATIRIRSDGALGGEATVDVGPALLGAPPLELALR